MFMSLKIIDFIYKNDNWEEILSNTPYSLNISYDIFCNRKLVMFKYDQCNSDFSIDLVKECRGLILDITDYETNNIIIPFSIPYFKFFNFGEPYASHIDWQTAITSSKIDGSLIKVVKYNNELLISTNGCIDAFKCNLSNQLTCPYKTFGEIVLKAIENEANYYKISEEPIEWFKSLLKPNFTYMFELVSPFNRIVIPYEEIKLYFHGIRNNITLKEEPILQCGVGTYFSMPKIFPLKTLNDCIDAANSLPWNDEGYVVCDKNFNRIKIKSLEYLKVHRLANNGNLSIRRAVELFMENDYDEILTYFPEYKPFFKDIEERFEKLIENIENDFNKLESLKLTTRKEKAIWIKNNSKYSGILFSLLDNCGFVREKLYERYERSKDSLITMMGLKI